jgi:hypothetical protein
MNPSGRSGLAMGEFGSILEDFNRAKSFVFNNLAVTVQITPEIWPQLRLSH